MKIGILGGGQLAQMIALAGIPFGYRFIVYDPSADVCSNTVATHIQGAYDDLDKLTEFANSVDIITYEFENVCVKAVEFLSKSKTVYPELAALEYTQDRLNEKNMLQSIGIPTAGFLEVNTRADIDTAIETMGLPIVLKTRSGGYDGKGQVVIKTADTADQAWSETGQKNLIAEAWVPFDREISIIAARSESGQTAFYELVENTHKDGILETSFNLVADSVQKQAESIIEKLLIKLDYKGVLALELFQVGEKLIANEYAPRVHNTGHWTIEGCKSSQFENHLRAILNLPLGSTESLGHCAMVNLVGKLPTPTDFADQANSHYHNYGKEARPGRKGGHLTIRTQDQEETRQLVQKTLQFIESL